MKSTDEVFKATEQVLGFSSLKKLGNLGPRIHRSFFAIHKVVFKNRAENFYDLGLGLDSRESPFPIHGNQTTVFPLFKAAPLN